jgi:SAM-dependent methyltransferase
MTDIREFFKRWPKFYFFVAIVFGPMMFCGLSAKKFLAKYPRGGRTLNIGSGPRIIGSEVENVDIHPYPGVSIIADATHLPLESNSISRIISDNVLEHVKNPQAAVAEMHRLLEAGGLAYIATPFLYPFHSSPSDYQRWSAEGLRELFAEFEVVELGVRAGPFSALTAYLCHMVGFIFSFGSAGLNSLLTNLSMFVLFPIKLLDLVFNYWPGAHTVAAVLYCVVRKK